MMKLSVFVSSRLRAVGDRWMIGWIKRRAEMAYERRHFQKALRLWMRAARVGDVESRFLVGDMYDRGEGVFRNLVEAAAWYRRAAEAGHANAQFRFGRILLHGASAHLSEKWRKTARNQNAAAAVAHALLPQGTQLEADPEKAIVYLALADQAGVTEASALLGTFYIDGHFVGQDYRKALTYFETAAAAEVAPGQFGLGDIFYRGLGVEADFAKAADWYEKAARQGHVRANIALATLHSTGKGRKLDQSKAAIYFAKAADANDPYALFQIGRRSLSGEGMPKNIERGETFLRKSAKLDHLPAILALAAFYSQGGNVEPNKIPDQEVLGFSLKIKNF